MAWHDLDMAGFLLIAEGGET